MPRILESKMFGDRKVYYRPNSTDEKVLREVIDNRAYRRASVGFDVEAGEHWLDLGANIGAFAIYCALKCATVECYEPEPGCFSILQKNAPEFKLTRACVTSERSKTIELWTSSVRNNFYRGTIVPKGMLSERSTTVPNLYAGNLRGKKFDGVKMDIEGSEFGIIDDWLLPDCNKLCFEYHTSRDRSMVNLSRRIATLRERFTTVAYVPELDRIMEMGGMQKSFHDRVIYCMK